MTTPGILEWLILENIKVQKYNNENSVPGLTLLNRHTIAKLFYAIYLSLQPDAKQILSAAEFDMKHGPCIQVFRHAMRGSTAT